MVHRFHSHTFQGVLRPATNIAILVPGCAFIILEEKSLAMAWSLVDLTWRKHIYDGTDGSPAHGSETENILLQQKGDLKNEILFSFISYLSTQNP